MALKYENTVIVQAKQNTDKIKLREVALKKEYDIDTLVKDVMRKKAIFNSTYGSTKMV